jgi:hypothetical protein
MIVHPIPFPEPMKRRSPLNIEQYLKENEVNSVSPADLSKQQYEMSLLAIAHRAKFSAFLTNKVDSYVYSNTSTSSAFACQVFSDGLVSSLMFFRTSVLTQATVLSELTAIDRISSTCRYNLRYVLFSPTYNTRYILEVTLPAMDAVSAWTLSVAYKNYFPSSN